MVLKDALHVAKHTLRSAGTPSPDLNAEVLMQRLLEVEKVFLIAHAERPMTAEEERKYFEWVERRAAGEPAQYITGRQEFWGLEFIVTPDVLIPRPETEHLVEAVLKLNRTEKPVIVDVGTGSGCIAVALAKEVPGARFKAVDRSKEALQVAMRNAERHGVCQQIDFIWGDLLSPFDLETWRETFDFVVSNPPYVPRTDRESLQREVREHEPAGALYAENDDPLQIYRQLTAESRPRLRPGGYLVVEIGAGQREALEQMLPGSDWFEVSFVDDLQSIPRVAVARKK